MNKKIIVAAVAAALATPMVALADAVVYGKVRVAIQSHSRDADIRDLGDIDVDGVGMQDHSSRVGLKGSEDLGDGLKAIYQMEFGNNVGDGTGAGFDWTARNSFVGLAGGWGTFLMGVHDTPMKISSGKLDFFADTAADYDLGSPTDAAAGVDLFNDNRVRGAITYISPSLSGFTFAGAVVQTTPTGPNATDDFQDAYSLAAMYGNGPWFASLAYEDHDDDSSVLLGRSFNESQWRLGLGILSLSNFSVSGVYENRSDIGFADSGRDSDAWQLQAAYDFGNNRVKAMYGQYDDDLDPEDFDTWAIGLQHNFSKRTDAQVLYRQKEFDNDGIGVDDDVFAVQLNHSF
jgi:predicted porin